MSVWLLSPDSLFYCPAVIVPSGERESKPGPIYPPPSVHGSTDFTLQEMSHVHAFHTFPSPRFLSVHVARVRKVKSKQEWNL